MARWAGLRLVWVALVLALAVAALYRLGGRMYTYEVETVITAGRQEVFRHLTDPELLPAWIGGLVSSRPLTEGGLRVGARSLEVIEENGKRIEMETAVVGFDPGRHFESTITAPHLEALSKYRLTPETGEKTRLNHVLEVRYKGILMRCIAPFAGGLVRRKLASDLERLKGLVEKS